MRTPALLLVTIVVGCGGRVIDDSHDATSDGTPADTPTAIDTRPTPIDSTPTPIDTGPPTTTCSACVAANCNAEFVRCSSDVTCKTGIDCLNACPTPDPGNTCANKCISDHPDEMFYDLVSCIAAKCKVPCFPG